jgi:hypothetical protein
MCWECIHLETIANTNAPDELLELTAFLKRRAVHHLPVIEDGLRESLTIGRATNITVEAEGLCDGEVSFDSEHRRPRTLLLSKDLSTTLAQTRVDSTDSDFWAPDLDEVDWLL